MNFILKTVCILAGIIPVVINAQSIHQQELDYHNSLGNANATYYEQHTTAAQMPVRTKSACNLDKVVYGWHPYWVGNTYLNYDWDLLSHFSFFSYEINPNTGNADNTHGWATSAAVDAALASGNTKVTLCATMFSGHSTFFASSTAQQTLITNLINLVQTRGAHGVQIDIEGLPLANKTDFANFMVNLSNQMHAAIPGSEVSTVLYAVDWSNVFDFATMEPEVDHYIIMGYDYYWRGSATAGPSDPLFQFGNSYNFNLSQSTAYYMGKGCPKNKLVLGLPYYGWDWPTSSAAIPGNTTANATSRTYKDVKNNSTGDFTTANYNHIPDAMTSNYTYGTTRQLFITLEDDFNKRLAFIEQTDIAGMGIWALGYDDGYTHLWDAIEDNLTDCQADECTGTIHDFGGPLKDYYNNEDYNWTIDPPGTTALTFNFSQFDIEANYDYLYIYDGADINATQIAGSPFTGTTSPGTFTSSTGAVTFRWTSDGATTAPGFIADWTCNQDIVAPTTISSHPNTWETANFTATFTDADNNGIQTAFYNVSDYDGVDWSANDDNGFFNEEFEQTTLSTDWTNSLGVWNLVAGSLHQTDEVESNTNLYASLTQDNAHTYLYHWTGQIGGTGANRRAGIHFFCDDATQTQRGNSYMVYFRTDNDKCQIYNALANSITIQTDDDVVVDPNITYDFKILYNPSSGLIQVFLDDNLVSSWTDPAPLTTGNSISLRTGNCTAIYDDIRVYKSRNATETITVGNSNADIRYQNTNPSTPSGNVRAIVIDQANNWSTVSQDIIDVDWTNPSASSINDGLGTDIDIININTEISGNWTNSTDTHSGITKYEYAVGTSAGATNTINWTDNGTATSFTASGLSLTYGTTYFVSVRSTNGAGLVSTEVSSDGQLLENPTATPVAGFSTNNTTVCEGDSIQLINNSTNATSYLWSVTGGVISDNTANNPYVVFASSGTYNVTLVANGPGGTDQINQNVTVTVNPGPIASATPNNTTVNLPNAIVSFTNSSSNASAYTWDFGDGNTSTDQNPWNLYGSIGTYDVTLVAINSGCSNDTIHFTINVEDTLTSSAVEKLNWEMVTTYPNPFEDNIIIKGLDKVDAAVNISIIDMTGKQVVNYANLATQPIMYLNDLGNLSKGVYQLIIRTESNSRGFGLVK